MKKFFLLRMVLGNSIAFCSQTVETVAIRVSRNESSHRSFLLEVFHFNFSFTDLLLPLESKLKHDTSLTLNDSDGFFLLEDEKITWQKEDYIIQPGIFLIQMKSSKHEIKLSGNLDDVNKNNLNVNLSYTFSRPIETEYGVGQDTFSFSCDSSLKFGQIQICGTHKTVEK